MLANLIKGSWDRVNARVDEYLKEDGENAFRMLFITDVHIGGPNAHHIEQLEALKELLPGSKIDFVVNGGDIGLDVGEDEEEAKRVIAATQAATEYGDVPYFFCKGNHDVKTGVLGREGLTPYLNRYFLSKVDPSKGKIVRSEENEGGYGYYLDPKTSTKFLLLNTCENVRGYDVSMEQLRFLVDELKDNSFNNVVVIGHYCFNECGAWVRYPSGLTKRMQALRDMERDFAKKGEGEFDGLRWDFSRSRGRLLFHLCGDSHFNGQSDSDGYLIACRQGYGGVDPEDVPESASVDLFDKHVQCDFDILAIGRSHAKLFRVGAGEGIRDIDVL